MSTPMYDLPEHCVIGVTAEGNGPAEGTPDFDHWTCWCGNDACGEVDLNLPDPPVIKTHPGEDDEW